MVLPCHNIQIRWGSRRAKCLMYVAVIFAVMGVSRLSIAAILLSAVLLLLASLMAVTKMGRHVTRGTGNAQLERLARMMSVHAPTMRTVRSRRVSYAPSVIPMSNSSMKMGSICDDNYSRGDMTCEVSQVSDLCTIDVHPRSENRHVNMRVPSCPVSDKRSTNRQKWKNCWHRFRRVRTTRAVLSLNFIYRLQSPCRSDFFSLVALRSCGYRFNTCSKRLLMNHPPWVSSSSLHQPTRIRV